MSTPLDSRLWLPFTQMRGFDPSARTFVRGVGVELEDARGARLFDATSSIWTTIHGHGHPAIVEAISRQAATLDHATTLGASNPPAEALAQRLCALTGLDHAFFSADGASAVEAALKMALQYWANLGEPERTRFVRFVDSYHGDTTGAMSLSDIGLFKAPFGAITFETLPYDAMARCLARDDVAAVFVEPLVQAAAGMRLVPIANYAALRGARKPLLVIDEIATGFGRTGTMFAYEQLGIRPDLLCVGKGLTGGTLALSATLVSERVYAAFLAQYRDGRHFFHGHSYAGNPIACAASLASLDLFQREDTLERARSLAAGFSPRLDRLRTHPSVRQVRAHGLMVGIELHAERLDARGAISAAWRVANQLYEQGHFTRPIGDVIQLVPPLISELATVEAFFDALEVDLVS
ncbi:MAG: aminotransferase family protein [Vulcanimicrobiaceae bacterium]